MAERTARRFPPWLKRRVTHSPKASGVRALLQELRLETVCQQAMCPNIHECFAKGTATFMIMGKACTRGCRFCGVSHAQPTALDEDEPRRVAEAAARLALSYVVVTSVTRDDLPDGGSHHFYLTATAIHERTRALVEVLTPDFNGDRSAVLHVLEAPLAVFNHNVETVPRLYPEVRPEADYERSLAVLGVAAQSSSTALVKSGMMVGLGETAEEVLGVLEDLRSAGCDMVTIGQYLSPTSEHLPVERFVTPEEFEAYGGAARGLGFRGVASGPFVRSSYSAASLLVSARS